MIVCRGFLRQPSRRDLLIGGSAGLSAALLGRAGADERPVAVLAAASLRPALDEIASLRAEATGTQVAVTYGASDALVQQLNDGAPADLLVSGEQAAMDFAVERRLIRPETRCRLVGNRLVLVAQKTSGLIEVLLGPGTRLSQLVQGGRIAIGEPEMQAGGVARAALESLGLWADAEPCAVAVDTSRAAAALVGRGEATLGVVFASDARLEPAVKVVGVFPEMSHAPIVYEAGATLASSAGGLALLDFLQDAAARAVFEKCGFILPP
jgi:molybdate transport system substrate-binding protein